MSESNELMLLMLTIVLLRSLTKSLVFCRSSRLFGPVGKKTIQIESNHFNCVREITCENNVGNTCRGLWRGAMT